MMPKTWVTPSAASSRVTISPPWTVGVRSLRTTLMGTSEVPGQPTR